MGKSARQLGRELGLTAEETNVLLKEEGLLDGEPGDYYVTSKGEEHATEVGRHRGPGGSPWYNRSWTERYWDDDILDDIEITEEKKQNARDIVSERKRQQREERKKAEEEAERIFQESYNEADEFADSNDEEYTGPDDNSGKGVVAFIIGIVLLIVALGVPKIVKKVRKRFSKNINEDNTKDEEVPIYICPSCKSDMYYDEEKELWECESCKSTLNHDEINKKVYLCKNCKTILHLKRRKKNSFVIIKCRKCGTENTIAIK